MVGAGTLDPNTPVIVAVGQVEQRTDDLDAAHEPTALLAEAARLAQADSGSDRLLASVDTLAVVHIISHHYSDPAALVAAELGIEPARRLATDDGGNFPQTLLNRACQEIASGASTTWMIGGAEAWRSFRRSRTSGTLLGWTHQHDATPTETLRNPQPLFHPGELARQVFLPTEIYALFENALRAAEGWTIEEHRDRLATLYAGFSEVAARNPHAWIQRTFSPEEIREATPDNRMIGFPYTKLMNANEHVEQAACVVVTSVGNARALGITTDRWVFPWAGTDAHEQWHVSHRWSLAAAPAIRAAGRRALALADTDVDSVAHIDVYSCFPSAVQIAAKELGVGTDRPLTVTGGLSFAGGPWNNYVSHSIATMTERLRDDAGSIGLITANGGFLTKHAFGVYSTTPPRAPWCYDTPQAEVDALPARTLAEVVDDDVTVETGVVVFGADGEPDHLLVSTLLDDGRRAWAGSTDRATMDRFVEAETAGHPGHVDPDGAFTLT